MNFNYNIKVTENTPQPHEVLEAWIALGWRCKIVGKKALTTHDR